MNKAITLPLVWLGGTSPGRLIDQYSDAATAVGRALEAINAIEFDMRDYYGLPNGRDEWTRACREMDERRNALRAVQSDFTRLALHVMEKDAERQARLADQHPTLERDEDPAHA